VFLYNPPTTTVLYTLSLHDALPISTGEYLSKILENTQKAIDSGKMEFKPKKAGRVSVQLNQLIGTTHLAEKQEKGRRFLTRRRELLRSAECKDMYERRKGLLSKIGE